MRLTLLKTYNCVALCELEIVLRNRIPVVAYTALACEPQIETGQTGRLVDSSTVFPGG